jgi:hypothetical protein
VVAQERVIIQLAWQDRLILGGGGGGGGFDGNVPGAAGGAGGSGIVILKYLVPVGTTVTHIYKGSGSWVAPTGVTAVDYLVVAGGGGAGQSNGGGGGAGGFRTGTGFLLLLEQLTQLL